MAVLGIDHVQLAAPAGCEDDARAFFADLLGMPELPKPESLRQRGGVWFACGSHELHIGVEAEFAPARKAHPALRVDDLDATQERLERAGHATNSDDAIRGVRRFYVDDPWGNRLELIEA